ncbi:PAS domain S-box protein [Halosolutus amylolyticus]|uniref:histidine kinase n=1 Tax=Halosolutus amylolyticus TaxID=2932267 RepID=A0ABD5PQL1_9EURY|nr:PAS domain S-box protein [Halosolutus amylolyticus]
MATGTNVLWVDDDPAVRDAAAPALERASDDVTVTVAATVSDARSQLDERADDVDCVVSGYDLPETNGLDFFETVRERHPGVAFILCPGSGSETIASDAIGAGVTDYVPKQEGRDRPDELATRITSAVPECEERSAIRTRSERELDRYRTLVQTVADPMYMLDDGGTITMVNDAMVALLGYERDWLLGRHISAVFDEEMVERGRKTLYGLLESDDRDRARFEFTFETRDGDRRTGEANLSPLRSDDGTYVGSVGVVRDITRHRERERDLSEYETIVETAPTKLFVLDADARIVWMNAKFAAGFEESRTDLLGTRFPTLIDRGYFDEQVTTQYVEEVRKLLSSEVDLDRAKYDVQFRTADGDERVYDVHTKLLPFEDGEFAGTIHAMRDITRRRRYQRELERQNERLEEFAGFVSHDLRNPLNVAQGSLALLEEGADGSHLEDLRWSLSRMAELVDDLLGLARHGTAVSEQEWVSLADVAADAWATVETGDARLEIETDRDLYADESCLRELFENLFRNAIEHGSTGSQDGGHPDAADADHMIVSVGPLPGPRDDRGEVDSGSDAPATDAGFYVADTGAGLPPDRESIFEFGHTTAADGTGLGLAIVEEIVTAHGWSIAARDARAGGARFEIEGVRTDETEMVIESPDA